MARRRRIWLPGAKYHIISRGIRKLPLFYDDDDFLAYILLIAETKGRYPFKLHTYCLMTNHTHLQLETIETPPSLIMKHLNTKYAKYLNKKYGFAGHVFDKRYIDEHIDSGKYELDVSKYIHLNPVKAGMAANPEDYLWSSFRFYIHDNDYPLIDKSQILSYFPNPYFSSYESFVKAPITYHSEVEVQPCGQK